MVDVFVWDLGIDDIVVVEEEGRVGYGFGFRGCCWVGNLNILGVIYFLF